MKGRIVLWSAALATVTGNTLVVKPSERDPGATMIIAELCERAGTPFVRVTSVCADSQQACRQE